MNTTNKEIIHAAEAMLIKQKPHIKTFALDNGQDLLLSGEVDITMEWNGEISQVMDEGDDLSYVVPKEGSIIWQDTPAIPEDAQHPENAHKFINYLLDAEAGANSGRVTGRWTFIDDRI